MSAEIGPEQRPTPLTSDRLATNRLIPTGFASPAAGPSHRATRSAGSRENRRLHTGQGLRNEGAAISVSPGCSSTSTVLCVHGRGQALHAARCRRVRQRFQTAGKRIQTWPVPLRRANQKAAAACRGRTWPQSQWATATGSKEAPRPLHLSGTAVSHHDPTGLEL